MRKIRYQVACTLDGYIAGPNGEIDWIVMDPDIDFAELMSSYDTLLMGRSTYETLPGGAGAFGGMRIVVLSRTLKQSDHPGVTIIADDVAAGVEALRAGPGKDIWLFGGGATFQSLYELGCVDTIEPAIIPVILGGGLPMYPPGIRRRRLKLTARRVYEKTGIVLLQYDVEADKPKRRAGVKNRV